MKLNNQAYNHVIDQVGKQLWKQSHRHISSQVSEQVYKQVWDKVSRELTSCTSSKLKEYNET